MVWLGWRIDAFSFLVRIDMESIFKETPKLSEKDQALVRLYVEVGRPVDDLPYTAEFEKICQKIFGLTDNSTQRHAFDRLLRFRKSGRLPRVGRLNVDRTPITDDEEEILSNLIVRSAGTIGHRDALPYTAEFDQIVDAFNQQTRRNLDAHTVWRMVSRVAKWPTNRGL